MAIAEIFSDLKSLQSILVEKYDLEAKVQSAPKDLVGQEEALARSKKEFIVINTNYDEVKEVVYKLRTDLDAAVKSREEGEKGMDAITTHREYEALEKQINEATARESELRQELQQNEKKLADLNEKMKEKEDEINGWESQLADSRESLDKEISGYNARLAELKVEEDKITPNLDQEILFKFQRIIQRNSEGIVSVKGNVCSGCHMILPEQFANVVHTGEGINFCPYCSRILFYEEVSEEEQEAASFNFSAAGSLAGFDDDDDDYLFDDDDENEDSERIDDDGFDRINDDDSFDDDDEREEMDDDDEGNEEDDED